MYIIGGLNIKVLTKTADVQEATLAALGMMLKCADVMHMTQPFPKHQQWVSLLTEEFFQQGDRELGLGMQPMPFMNRSKPQCVPSSQVCSCVGHILYAWSRT